MQGFLKKILFVESIKTIYSRYEGKIGGATLLFGFILDNLTIASVSISVQTYIFIVYILLGGFAILALHYLSSREERQYPRAHFWFFLLFQFSIGSLFSMFFAFYSRGVSIAASWPFLLVLLALTIGSELWKKHYLRLSLQVSLYFIAIFSLSIYALPIIFHELSTRMFLLGGVLALLLVALFVRLLVFVSAKRVKEWRRRIIVGVSAVFILLNILYFTGAIPPVPLVMRNVGVHHSLQWDGVSQYIATSEVKPWWSFILPYPTYHHIQNDPVYVMAAVYAPTDLETTIIHEWQRYNGDEHKWVSEAKIRVPIVGGRESGYRTYSMKQILSEGLWRVDVKTATGQIIGRLRFSIDETDFVPPLVVDYY
ncbi:MAG: DUF2914 domain-containing protein [Candidatus Paceibacterota bacterium]|jgi:hypothetical protein